MKIIKKTLIGLLILAAFNGHSQSLNFGIHAGSNMNFVSVPSDYNIQDGKELAPCISYNIGVFGKTGMERFNFLGAVDYMRLKNRLEPGIVFYDEFGMPMGVYNSSIINHNILFSAIGTINMGFNMYFGLGVTTGLLIHSSTKLDNPFIIYDRYHTNHFYQRMLLSLPVTVGYEFNQFNAFVKFNRSILNKHKKESNINELDNTLSVGIGYRFRK